MKGPIKREGGTYIDSFEWWREKTAEYTFQAIAPTSVRPEIVPGDHASMGLIPRTGWRLWAFKTEAERDQFCTQFGGQRDPR